MNDDVASARAEREKVLLAKWAAGKASAREISEIEHLIGGVAGESKSAAWAYRHTYDHYEGELATSGRQLKRYVARGKESGDPFPLDEPHLIAEWWGRNMRQRCPQKFMKLAASAVFAAPDPLPAGENDAESPQIALSEGGFLAALEGIRREERAAAAAMRQAEQSGNHALVDMAQRRYQGAVKRLREWEKDAPAQLQKLGELIPRREAEQILRLKHGTVVSALRGLPTLLYTRLRGAIGAQITLEAFTAAFQGELDSIFAHLGDTGFEEKPPETDG